MDKAQEKEQKQFQKSAEKIIAVILFACFALGSAALFIRFLMLLVKLIFPK
jgi:hypothetical protein